MFLTFMHSIEPRPLRGRDGVVTAPHLLKGGYHVLPVVLYRAVGSELKAAVEHWSPKPVKAHWVHVMCPGISQTCAACDALNIYVTPPF